MLLGIKYGSVIFNPIAIHSNKNICQKLTFVHCFVIFILSVAQFCAVVKNASEFEQFFFSSFRTI